MDMMDKRSIYYSCVLLSIMICVVVQADIGDVHDAVKTKLQQCLSSSSSSSSKALRHSLLTVLVCVESSVYRCLLFLNPTLETPYTEIRDICGVINTGQLLKPTTWEISVPSKFSLYLNFLHFQLPSQDLCQYAYLYILARNNHGKYVKFKYCGYRIPWYISFLGSSVMLKLSVNQKQQKGYNFFVTYEAFDVKLSSVGLVQRNEQKRIRCYGTLRRKRFVQNIDGAKASERNGNEDFDTRYDKDDHYSRNFDDYDGDNDENFNIEYDRDYSRDYDTGRGRNYDKSRGRRDKYPERGVDRDRSRDKSRFRDRVIARRFAFLVRSIANTFKTEINLHILVTEHDQIIVHCSTKAIVHDLYVHDGPGNLSPIIHSNRKRGFHRFFSTGYQAFVSYRLQELGNVSAEYHNALRNSFVDSSVLKWSCRKVESPSNDCIQLQNSTVQFDSSSGYCWGQRSYSHITIHHMIFNGYDSLLYEGSSMCEYGGLFISTYNVLREQYEPDFTTTICSNIKSRIVLPYLAYENWKRSHIVFKTFKGYSSGYIFLTIDIDFECVGLNYLSFLHGYALDRRKTWTDTAQHEYQPQIEKCTDVWFLHFGIHDTDRLGECLVPVTPEGPFDQAVGPFKLIMFSSIFYGHPSYFMDPKVSIDIYADTVKDFPVNLTTEKVQITTTLSETHEYDFPPANKLSIKLNFSEGSSKFTLALRIQIIEKHICSSVENLHPFDISQIYHLNRDIIDIYLSQWYPYNGLAISYMNYTGHNLGTCRMLLEGQTCSPWISSYKPIRINYRPIIKLKAAHSIDISMMKVANCSIDCPLDIEIWEILDNIAIPRTRYHRWKSILSADLASDCSKLLWIFCQDQLIMSTM